ncbi:glycosyltransferase [Pedobacter frigiditerrae]|uniref:glycosyltransferase n=1 Tax=Pedobacter frigiditerrae TaxID=2530452 RepID=UPI002930A5A6|nr:glycosyltransferase [Pedobacter frigiditerrae]
MKILHVMSSLDPAAGGVTQAVKTMINGLNELEVNNQVACLDDPRNSFLSNLPFKIYAFGPNKTPWKFAPALLNWLKINMDGYDVVIVHGLWQYHTYATIKAIKTLKGIKPKLYVMPHGMLDPYFQKAKGRKIKAIRNWAFWKLIEKQLVNNATGLLFTCEAERNLAATTFSPYQPRATVVVGLGVEAPPMFTPRMEAAFNEKIGKSLKEYLIYLGRIDQKKGVDLLVKAYLRLVSEKENLPPLVIAGPGLDTPFGAAILQLVNGNKNVLFPGMLSGDAKWGAFYGASTFILPSHQENFGIAVVEALACGKPVLISDQVNIWNEIVAGLAGLVANDTELGTYNLLRDWFEKKDKEKKDMCIFALDTFNSRFSVENAAKCLLGAIK